MISFGIKYWTIFLPLILILAAGLVLLLYFRNNDTKEFTRQQRWILMVLRFVSVGTIAFLLLSPFLEALRREVQNPLVIAAWDNSGSVVAVEDSAVITEQILQLKDHLSTELGSDYKLFHYTFGQEINLDGPLNFSEKKSDYGNLVSTLSANHFNERVGAVILIGDGIYNQGRNPVNMIDDMHFPVFTVGLGDTLEPTDARISGIRVNRTSFAGNRFPVEIDANFSKLQGRPMRLTISHNGEEVAQNVITPAGNDYFVTRQFILDAGEAGLKHFTAEIEPAEGEQNIKNNSDNFVVNVLEDKQKILILSNGPHPDIGAIKFTLEQQKAYEISVFYEEPYPSDLSAYNLVILHQLPSAGKSMSALIARDETARIPLLFITGVKTFLPQLNSLSVGVEIEPLAGSAVEAQASVNPSFGSFSLSERFRELLAGFPPLMAPFANYMPDPGMTSVLFQRINNLETNRPLLVAGIVNGRKTGFLFGEGIWKWRLNNYLKMQTHDQFNELINQLVQYLALRENEDNFIVSYQPVYSETDEVILTAEVYNDVFEQISSEEVTIEIRHENGDSYDFTFDVRGNGYILNAGNLPVGDYNFTAHVTIGDHSYTETGNFAVTEMNLENVVTQANHRMLYQLAARSGGMFFEFNDATKLFEHLQDGNHLKPEVNYQEIITEFLNLRWLFLMLIFLLSMEWFLRKYWGIY